MIFFVCSKFLNGSATHASICPFFILLKSGTSIEAINSDFITSSIDDILAPFSSYSAFEYPDFLPAFFSIITSNPSFDSLGTETGTIATRVSFSFFSFGIPIRIVYTVNCDMTK